MREVLLHHDLRGHPHARLGTRGGARARGAARGRHLALPHGERGPGRQRRVRVLEVEHHAALGHAGEVARGRADVEDAHLGLEGALDVVEVGDVVARRQPGRVAPLAVELRDGHGALLAGLVVPRGRVRGGGGGGDGGGEGGAARHA